MSKRRGFQHPKVQLSPVHHGHHQIAVRRGRDCGLAGLRQKHGASPRRAGSDSSKGLRHLPRERPPSPWRAPVPRPKSTGCSRDGPSQLLTEHGFPARRAPDRSREGRGLLSRWRRPLPRSVASGSGLQASRLRSVASGPRLRPSGLRPLRHRPRSARHQLVFSVEAWRFDARELGRAALGLRACRGGSEHLAPRDVRADRRCVGRPGDVAPDHERGARR